MMSMGKVSFMGSGLPIIQRREGGMVAVDKRKAMSPTQRRKAEVETIKMQGRLLEAEQRQEVDLLSSKRDSCDLYDNDELIIPL